MVGVGGAVDSGRSLAQKMRHRHALLGVGVGVDIGIGAVLFVGALLLLPPKQWMWEDR